MISFVCLLFTLCLRVGHRCHFASPGNVFFFSFLLIRGYSPLWRKVSYIEPTQRRRRKWHGLTHANKARPFRTLVVWDTWWSPRRDRDLTRAAEWASEGAFEKPQWWKVWEEPLCCCFFPSPLTRLHGCLTFEGVKVSRWATRRRRLFPNDFFFHLK